MATHLVVFPAYGRVIKTNDELRTLFIDGKDFSAFMRSGPYLSIRDFLNHKPLLEQYAGVILSQPSTRGEYLNVMIDRAEMEKANEPK